MKLSRRALLAAVAAAVIQPQQKWMYPVALRFEPATCNSFHAWMTMLGDRRISDETVAAFSAAAFGHKYEDELAFTRQARATTMVTIDYVSQPGKQ